MPKKEDDKKYKEYKDDVPIFVLSSITNKDGSYKIKIEEMEVAIWYYISRVLSELSKIDETSNNEIILNAPANSKYRYVMDAVVKSLKECYIVYDASEPKEEVLDKVDMKGKKYKLPIKAYHLRKHTALQ